MNRKLICAAIAATCCSMTLTATAAITKDEHKAAIASADASYKSAKAGCDSLAGNARDVCKADAKAEYVRLIAKADAGYKGTPASVFDGQKKIAKADYEVAKARCDALAGNDKDVCVKEAKAAEVRVLADAKASNKSIDAFADAGEAKRTADYRVAVEKCDTFSGAAKDSCIRDAKATYGK
ncbi:MAG: hypothetical protein JNN20_04510 [Betaproteobacteria bacterium]|nr:hypothetical protein [Betaproteobacteria bacterium]